MDDRQEVEGVEGGGNDQHRQHEVQIVLEGAGDHVPLGHEARRGRHTNHAQGADGEGGHGQRHAQTDAVQLRYLGLAGSDVDGAGGEEQRDLGKGVGHHVHGRTDFGERCEHQCREHDVGQLADRGIGQQALDVVLAQGYHRGRDDGESGQIDQQALGRDARQEIGAEDVDDHLGDGEHAGLDHGHCMQQCRYRRWRHHGRRQPAVHGHHRRLAHAQHEQCQQQRRLGLASLAGEDAARGKADRAGDAVGVDDGRQQQSDRGGQQNAEIGARTLDGVAIPGV